jgi:hypothetical protein
MLLSAQANSFSQTLPVSKICQDIPKLTSRIGDEDTSIREWPFGSQTYNTN